MNYYRVTTTVERSRKRKIPGTNMVEDVRTHILRSKDYDRDVLHGIRVLELPPTFGIPEELMDCFGYIYLPILEFEDKDIRFRGGTANIYFEFCGLRTASREGNSSVIVVTDSKCRTIRFEIKKDGPSCVEDKMKYFLGKLREIINYERTELGKILAIEAIGNRVISKCGVDNPIANNAETGNVDLKKEVFSLEPIKPITILNLHGPGSLIPPNVLKYFNAIYFEKQESKERGMPILELGPIESTLRYRLGELKSVKYIPSNEKGLRLDFDMNILLCSCVDPFVREKVLERLNQYISKFQSSTYKSSCRLQLQLHSTILDDIEKATGTLPALSYGTLQLRDTNCSSLDDNPQQPESPPVASLKRFKTEEGLQSEAYLDEDATQPQIPGDEVVGESLPQCVVSEPDDSDISIHSEGLDYQPQVSQTARVQLQPRRNKRRTNKQARFTSGNVNVNVNVNNSHEQALDHPGSVIPSTSRNQNKTGNAQTTRNTKASSTTRSRESSATSYAGRVVNSDVPDEVIHNYDDDTLGDEESVNQNAEQVENDGNDNQEMPSPANVAEEGQNLNNNVQVLPQQQAQPGNPANEVSDRRTTKRAGVVSKSYKNMTSPSKRSKKTGAGARTRRRGKQIAGNTAHNTKEAVSHVRPAESTSSQPQPREHGLNSQVVNPPNPANKNDTDHSPVGASASFSPVFQSLEGNVDNEVSATQEDVHASSKGPTHQGDGASSSSSMLAELSSLPSSSSPKADPNLKINLVIPINN